MGYVSALYHRRNNKVIVWERINGQRIVRYYEPEFYFYVPSKTGTHYNIYGEPVRKFSFSTREEFDEAINHCDEKGIRTFEKDVPIEIRTLSTHYHDSPSPALTITFFDIEVAYDKNIGFAGIENPYAPINSIALYHSHQSKYIVFAVQPSSDGNIYGTNGKRFGQAGKEFYELLNDIAPLDKNIEVFFCKDEKELLLKFLDEIEESDVISGYNSDFFDIPYIGKRLEKIGQSAFKRLSFQEAPAPRYRLVEKKGWGKENETLDIYGRIKADYLDLYKKYEVTEKSSYKLESIADEVLPELPKLEYEGNLADLYTSNFPWFIRYNIRDTEILKGFEDKLGYVALSNELYHLSTGLFKNITGTLRLAEFATINYCHHKLGNLVVPNCKETNREDDDDEAKIMGAFVLEPRPGMHEWIGSIDINSLYPSAIRAINISPETLVGQFETNVDAADAIAKSLDTPLTFVFDGVGGIPSNETETHTAKEWRDILRERKQAVSGYGTVFSQKKKGIIPTILEDWYSMRKHYQKLMKEAKAAGDKEKAAYYNRLQFVFKIKLNSFYGALTNPYFRFFDERMGESTTGTGRMILRHQCAKVNEILTGEYLDSGGVIIYGDTDSTYFETRPPNNTAEQAIKIADAVARKVNESFEEFMGQTFLCGSEYSTLIKAGREIVSDRGIFVEKKKRYILHVIDNEGERVDKMKIMGMDTKKTTMPKQIGNKLNKFIERLLKGESWDDIGAEIVAYKKELTHPDNILAIGLPRGIKGVEKYTEDFENLIKPRIPGHVMASIFYNRCLKRYNDKAHAPITSGQKIKVFYLAHVYDNTFKSIALPTDIETIPEWFYNFQIDYKAHIERLVDNPLEGILNAIKKRIPEKHELTIGNFFEF